MERIGLVAGSGNFPSIFAKEAKKKGAAIICFAIKDITSPEITRDVDKVHWIDPAKFKIQNFVFLLFTEKIKKMILAGKIDKTLLFDKFKKSSDITGVLKQIKDGMDYSILQDLTKRFAQIGIELIDGLEYLRELLPQKGVLTKRSPGEEEMKDIEFGINIAREIARLDIGQTIAVKNKAIIAVEAMEGTDDTIKRAANLAKTDFVVIKTARPKQDMRWDVPLVGFQTILAMIESKARVLAIESDRMFLVDKPKVIKEADLNDISIYVF